MKKPGSATLLNQSNISLKTNKVSKKATLGIERDISSYLGHGTADSNGEYSSGIDSIND